MTAKDWKAIVIIVSSVAVVALLVVLGQVFTDNRLYDEVTLCPTASNARHTIVVIDKSDRWDENDVSRIDSLLNEINRGVSSQERLTIVSIAGVGREATNVSTVFGRSMRNRLVSKLDIGLKKVHHGTATLWPLIVALRRVCHNANRVFNCL